MENAHDSQAADPRAKRLRLLGWSLMGFVVVAIVSLYFYAADPRCIALLVHSEAAVPISLPPNCMLTADTPDDEMVKYLENDRKWRGLVFKAWIICKPSNQAQATDFAFTRDPRWLPSYVPRAYQFRRTVIITPVGQRIPRGSAVAAEVCLMPRWRYALLIAGQCDGKFSVWK